MMRLAGLLLVLALLAVAGCHGGDCSSSRDCPTGFYCFGHCRPLADAGTGIIDSQPMPDIPPRPDGPPPDVLTAIDVVNVDVAEQAGVAVLELEELNPNLSAGDLVELKVLRAGSLTGIQIVQNPAPASSGSTAVIATLPAVSVVEGELILVHAPPAVVTTETGTKSDCSTSSGCSNNAWDVMGTSGLTYGDRVVAVRAPNGTTLQDAVPFTNNATSQGDFGKNIDFIQAAGMWHPADCGGTTCAAATAAVQQGISASWSNLSTTTSVRRVFSNRQQSDWIKGSSTFGQ